MILPLCCLLWHLATPAWAQETLSLKECREMALKYNKEMAASVKQTARPLIQPKCPLYCQELQRELLPQLHRQRNRTLQ